MKYISNFYRFLFGTVLTLSSLLQTAQNETAKWYFGNGAGLDFMANPPTILTNGALFTMEGCSTVSDATGNLLFYTNGITVWNQTHAVMANGTGLQGNTSTTQSALIVKQPGSSNLYFIFTMGTGATGGGPLNYSIVDMTLAAGMGSVTVKNASLTLTSTEKLTAVRHCNGVDIWILSHDRNTSDFRVYLLTSTGVNASPVISTAGTPYNTGSIGYLKASSNGKKLGACFNLEIELYDFQSATGVVSNPLSLGTSTYAYGCEFSPDGTKFYAVQDLAPNNPIHQWDLCAGSNTAIVASHTVVGNAPGVQDLGALQLAINGKIYLACFNKNALGVINNPNVYGTGCNFVNLGQSIAPKICQYGLQNCINDFLKPSTPVFTYTANCYIASFTAPQSSTANLGCSASNDIATGQLWTFGEPFSGPANSSTLANPAHSYSTTGTYTVKLVRYFPCSSDTSWLPVTITNASNLGVAGTFSICNGETRTFTVSGVSSYTWSNGANTTTVALSPTVTTTYSVTGTATNSCGASKLFTVSVLKCVGIEQLEADETIPYIYPNPVNGSLHLEAKNPVRLTILNQVGSLVFEGSFESGEHTIDTGSFSSGIYTAKLATEKGLKTFRIIKLE